MGLFTPDVQRPRGERGQLWDTVYEQARDAYERTIDGYDEEDSRLTALAAVRGWYPRGPSGLARCPDPQPFRTSPAPINLGLFLEIHYCLSNGLIESRSFAIPDKVPLLWSETLRACFVFPYLSPGACARLPTPSEDRVMRRWTDGRRGARCARPVAHFPAPPLPLAYPAIAITYYSDKFSTTGTWERYIHHFEPGVVAYFARSSGSDAPTAIMVRGGKLRLETHGLTG